MQAHGGHSFRSSHGYTLVELLAVLTVLSVLAMATLPLAEVTLQRERERELRRALWEIRDAIDAYKRAADSGLIDKAGDGYPPTLDVLVSGVPASGARGGQRLYFLRRLPRDPFAPPSLEAGRTWGLRSLASPPERPEPGADVYDVYSLAPAIGLNGKALKEW